MVEEKFMLVSLQDSRLKKIAEVLANKTSKKIINYLAETKEASAKDLSDELNLAMNTVDYNLKKLLSSEIIKKRKNFFWSSKGKKIVMYELSNKSIIISPKNTQTFSKLKSLLPAFLLTGSFTVAVYVYEKIHSLSVMTKDFQPEISEELYAVAQDSAANSISNFVYTPTNPLWIWFLAGSLLAILIFTLVNWRKL